MCTFAYGVRTYKSLLYSCVNDKVDGAYGPQHVLALLGREEDLPGSSGPRFLTQVRQQPTLAWTQNQGNQLAQFSP